MIVGTMHNTPFTDMNDSEGEVQQAGYAAFQSGSRTLRLLTAFVPACRINEERVSRSTDAACITITELSDTLVREEGLNPRQAHSIAATVAGVVIRDERALAEAYETFAAAFTAVTGRDTALDDTAFQAAVSAEEFVARRERPGGPGPLALRAAFDGYGGILAELRAHDRARVERHSKADKRLTAAFAGLM